jgi:hypothetical protein
LEGDGKRKNAKAAEDTVLDLQEAMPTARGVWSTFLAKLQLHGVAAAFGARAAARTAPTPAS